MLTHIYVLEAKLIEVSQEENSHSANVNISLVCSAPRPVAATARVSSLSSE